MPHMFFTSHGLTGDVCKSSYENHNQMCKRLELSCFTGACKQLNAVMSTVMYECNIFKSSPKIQTMFMLVD